MKNSIELYGTIYMRSRFNLSFVSKEAKHSNDFSRCAHDDDDDGKRSEKLLVMEVRSNIE